MFGMPQRFVSLTLFLLAACGSSAKEPEPKKPQPGTQPESHASRLEVVSLGGDVWKNPQVEVMESMPVQFALSLSKDMPTPGWKLAVAKRAPATNEGLIVVQVDQTRPEGMGAAMMDPQTLRIPLDSLAVGNYRIRIEVREGAGPFKAEQTLELKAR